MSVQLPRLLDGAMQERARLHPSRVSLTLDLEPLSTATLRLPDSEPEVSVGDMVELFVPGRSAGVFRTASVAHDYVAGERILRLEHGLVTLGDAIVPGRHAFFGWDDGDPDTTVTGCRVCQDRYQSGTWYVAAMTVTNRDGSRVNLTFSHGTVLPVIARTEQGWRVPMTEQLLSAALTVNGRWDGRAATGVIRSDSLAECTPYSHAGGVTLRACDAYHRPVLNADGFGVSGGVQAGKAVEVHAECRDAKGNTFFAVTYVNSLGQTISTFVPSGCVRLDEGYTVGAETDASGQHMAAVADALIRAAHKQDTLWRFGESDFSEAFGYVFEDANLLEALLALPARLRAPYLWETDQRSLPWTLNLRRLHEDDLAELRLSRNVAGLSVTVDTADLVTCVLPLGRDGLTVESVNGGQPYVIADDMAQTWHIEAILRTDDATPEALYESALTYLQAHSQPSVSIAISALDLSGLTGEPLDGLRLGKSCRVPLPEYDLTVTERITRLHWPDVYGAPERVEVTLANQPNTASAMLAYLMKKGGTI